MTTYSDEPVPDDQSDSGVSESGDENDQSDLAHSDKPDVEEM